MSSLVTGQKGSKEEIASEVDAVEEKHVSLKVILYQGTFQPIANLIYAEVSLCRTPFSSYPAIMALVWVKKVCPRVAR